MLQSYGHVINSGSQPLPANTGTRGHRDLCRCRIRYPCSHQRSLGCGTPLPSSLTKQQINILWFNHSEVSLGHDAGHLQTKQLCFKLSEVNLGHNYTGHL